MRILLLQAEFFNALVFTGVMLLFLLRAPVAYLRINPQVEEVPEYLKTYSTNTSSTSLLYLQCFV